MTRGNAFVLKPYDERSFITSPGSSSRDPPRHPVGPCAPPKPVDRPARPLRTSRTDMPKASGEGFHHAQRSTSGEDLSLPLTRAPHPAATAVIRLAARWPAARTPS